MLLLLLLLLLIIFFHLYMYFPFSASLNTNSYFEIIQFGFLKNNYKSLVSRPHNIFLVFYVAVVAAVVVVVVVADYLFPIVFPVFQHGLTPIYPLK